jgi:hypothetical protein
MAYPRQLVQTIAQAFGLSEATVAVHDRLLAENGLRVSGGRGRSASQVRPEDAANLLIAIAGAPISGPSVRETIQTVARYAHLPAKHPTYNQQGNWDGIRALSGLTKGHSFSAALSEIIRAFARGDLETMDQIWAPSRRTADHDPGFLEVVVEIASPWPEAKITISGYRSHPTLEQKDVFLRYETIVPDDPSEWLENRRSLVNDLQQVRRFGENTFRMLARLFENTPKKNDANK